MSVENFVFINDSDLPEVNTVNQKLSEMQVDLVLDAQIDPRTHNGYWSATFHGNNSGFGWTYDNVSSVQKAFQDKSKVITLVTGNDLQELCCALYVAGAIASLSDGIVLDGDSGETMDAEGILMIAQEILEHNL
ncbi:MAG: hypothetical protein GFH27_549311n73 [Chloroflexi bacterium AL-W]|nr:hypothetical protein [Chloroflexi bacterium AL-N1]NOK68749.1 hypothetical protein [Chloroflexi bacterium AL-N10]NOK76235.1 hypothetical protein [Chloroflexi bacterium AL-N5]NOK84128.1 hypothetical protein [Chloroflexi bacterium AL-W]NOK91373.1 hypothetical protein [Chloroflexi bacterium AL-N15]